MSTRRSLLLLIATSTVVRSVLAFAVHTPIYYPDEYLYAALARAIGHGTLAFRGAHATLNQTVSYVGPVATAVFWRLGSVETGYRLSQAAGSLVFSLAAVPAFLLGRRAGLGTRGALTVALLALLVPAGVFTQTLLAEPYAYPAFLAAGVIALDALARSTWRRWLGACLASAVLVLTGGLQFAPFLPVTLAAAIASPSTPRQRRRAAAALAVLVGGAILVVVLARNRAPVSGFVRTSHQLVASPGSLLAWAGVNAFVIAVASGWVSIPGAVLGFGSLFRGERQFASFAVLQSAALLYEAAAWGANGQGVYERFAFYVTPFIAIGLLRFLDSTAPGRGRYAVLAYGLAAAAALVPLVSRLHAAADNAPTLSGLDSLGRGNGAIVWAPVLVVLAAAAGLIGPRRNFTLITTAAVCVFAGGLVARDLIDLARHRVLPRVDVATGTAYLTTPTDDYLSLMRTLFWNPAITRVAVVGGTTAPDAFGALPTSLAPSGWFRAPNGHGVDGPFVAGPATAAFRAGARFSVHRGLTVFEPPVDVLAFGWHPDDNYLSPFVQFLLSGRRSYRLELRSADATTKQISFVCDGLSERRLRVGPAPVSLPLRARHGATTACELRLIGGALDVVGGQDVGLRGALRSA